MILQLHNNERFSGGIEGSPSGGSLPLIPLTCIKYFWTGRLLGGLVQVRVAASARIPARETSGASGTSTPRMLISSGTGFQRVCHERCSNLMKRGVVLGKAYRDFVYSERRGGCFPAYQTTAPSVKTILKCVTGSTSNRMSFQP